MVRENQPLQIALIVFVMISILLGVTTYMFFKQADEAVVKAKASSDDATTAKNEKEKVQGENNELRRLMGFAATDTLETISQGFREDMDSAANSVKDTEKTYRKVVNQLNQVVQAKDRSLALKADEFKRVDDLLKAREESTKPRIAEFEAAAKKANEDLTSQRAEFNQQVAKVNESKEAEHTQFVASKAKSKAEVERLTDGLRMANDNIVKLRTTTEFFRQQNEKWVHPLAQRPLGQITFVNAAQRRVSINLGFLDHLNLQTKFNVYPAGAADIGGAEKKGVIEVVQLLGEHQAEARIVDDQIRDPILKNDVIYTPIWNPGEKKHFALVGTMDLNGDGKNLVSMVKTLIEQNGGVVDAYMDEKGKKVGSVTQGTRYVILGHEPDEKAGPKVLGAYQGILQEADRVSATKKTLAQLREELGYKPGASGVEIQKFGSGNTFRGRAPEEGLRTSTGNTSKLYEDRVPPKNTRYIKY